MTEKICPRCKQTFNCHAETIATCQCQQVMMSELQRQQLLAEYSGCLCYKCLVFMANKNK